MTHEQALELAAAFVLGILTPDEEAQVREHLATCPESHDEFAELGGVVPYLAETVDLVEPPTSLKARIMAAAAADLEARAPGVAAPPVPAPPVTRADPAPPVSLDAERARRSSVSTWLVRVAAVLVIAALGGGTLLLNNQIGDLRTDVAQLETQLAQAREYQEAVAAVLDVAADPNARTAVLRPQEPAGPRGIAAVAADGSVQLAMTDLAPTTGNEVYEAWAIGASGVPAPIGEFQVSASGVGRLTSEAPATEPGVTLALTREPGPDSTAPTLPILSLGVAGSSAP